MDAPPLPELTANPLADKQEVYNDWRTLIETVPLFAENSLFVASKTIPLAARSPFRTGTIDFSNEGIVIEGMVAKPLPRWLTLAMILAVFPQVSIQLLFTFGKKIGIPLPARLILIIVWLGCAFAPVFIRGRFDRNRVEAQQLLSWESLHTIQVDPKLRHITLIYASTSVARAKETLRESISLNQLDPNTVQGIITTLGHFAPHVVREDKAGPQNVRWVWVSVTVLIVFALVAIAAFVIVYLRRHATP